MMDKMEANQHVTRLENLLREVVKSQKPREEDMKWANYELASVPLDWFVRVEAAMTYVPA